MLLPSLSHRTISKSRHLFLIPSRGDDTHMEALFGANARVEVTDNIILTLDTEYALGDGTETRYSGQAGVEFNFK